MLEVLLKVENFNPVRGGQLVHHSSVQNMLLENEEYSTKQMILDIMAIDKRARMLFKGIITKHGIIDTREGSYVDRFLDTYDSPGVADYELLINEINNSKLYEQPLQ